VVRDVASGSGAGKRINLRRAEMAKHLRVAYSAPSHVRVPTLTFRGEPLDLDVADLIGKLDKLLLRRRRAGFLRLVVNERQQRSSWPPDSSGT
jgi:hypothetical protein